MRKSHVYERSYSRRSPAKLDQAGARATLLRKLAIKLGGMVDTADALGETALGDLLESARRETERLLSQGEGG